MHIIQMINLWYQSILDSFFIKIQLLICNHLLFIHSFKVHILINLLSIFVLSSLRNELLVTRHSIFILVISLDSDLLLSGDMLRLGLSLHLLLSRCLFHLLFRLSLLSSLLFSFFSFIHSFLGTRSLKGV
jgi:hypothetical protein